MFNEKYKELTLNARLARKIKRGILLSSSLVLLALTWLLFGHGIWQAGSYQRVVVVAFFAAGTCLVFTVPCLLIMLIHLRRLSIGSYELSISAESITRIHYSKSIKVAQEQWPTSHIKQVCISRSTLAREQTLVTGAWLLLPLFKDELYYTVYVVDAHQREHWLLTSSDCEPIHKVYQELRHLLPFINAQDYLDMPTHILSLPLWQSEFYGATYTRERGRATKLFAAGFILTGMSLMAGIFSYSTYVNGASGAWVCSTGTLLSLQELSIRTQGQDEHKIRAAVQYTRQGQLVSQTLELSRESLQKLGLSLSDTPRELHLYSRSGMPETLRLSLPEPTNSPYYFAILSLALLLSQIIPLRMLRPYPNE